MTFPADFTHPATKLVTAALAAESIAGLAAGRGAVVQAGGCIGLWPLALAQHFADVVTCEPSPENWTALCANIAGRPTITAYPCALGATPGTVGLTRPKEQAGLWRVTGDGPIPRVCLDALVAGPIDALVLDVEGSEVAAWQGAEGLIAAHRPLLWFEYLQHTADMDAFLAAHGYTRPQHGRDADYYSVHTSRIH